eukprot:TRINITY_DN102522_c0_g1_i1.p1 TRINITY_DN102522_c0_g1~~TRINITY_DN102522_c0_g1_i1.p1  ORF type:complete len:133 (-),score=17.69 TRINITY_DN102522_c0_g1_i1:101-499(-)
MLGALACRTPKILSTVQLQKIRDRGIRHREQLRSLATLSLAALDLTDQATCGYSRHGNAEMDSMALPINATHDLTLQAGPGDVTEAKRVAQYLSALVGTMCLTSAAISVRRSSEREPREKPPGSVLMASLNP